MKLRDFALLLVLACATVARVRGQNGTEGNRSVTTIENVEHTEKPHREGGICGPEHEEFDSSVHLARVEFERVETIFVILVFIMVVVVAKMCK